MVPTSSPPMDINLLPTTNNSPISDLAGHLHLLWALAGLLMADRIPATAGLPTLVVLAVPDSIRHLVKDSISSQAPSLPVISSSLPPVPVVNRSNHPQQGPLRKRSNSTARLALPPSRKQSNNPLPTSKPPEHLVPR